MVPREIILLFICAFFPPIIYSIWIRNTEKHNREKWKSIIVCFIWGATIAIIASLILEFILEIPLNITIYNGNIPSLSTAIIIAPFAEELTKPIALSTKIVKKELSEFEDGLIYGAVAGLGFSATENLFYGYSFLSEGLIVFLFLISIRSLGGCLLHASATALTGYGYGKTIIRRKSIIRVFPFFIFAVFLHSIYNFLVSFRFMGIISGLIIALILVIFSIRFTRRKIISLDLLNE